MDNELSLCSLLRLFRESKDMELYFDILFKRFDPLIKKYARLLGEEDMKYYLGETLYNSS